MREALKLLYVRRQQQQQQQREHEADDCHGGNQGDDPGGLPGTALGDEVERPRASEGGEGDGDRVVGKEVGKPVSRAAAGEGCTGV